MSKSTRKIETPRPRSAVAGECRKRAETFKDRRFRRQRTRQTSFQKAIE